MSLLRVSICGWSNKRTLQRIKGPHPLDPRPSWKFRTLDSSLRNPPLLFDFGDRVGSRGLKRKDEAQRVK